MRIANDPAAAALRGLPPTNPYHIARAYGLRSAAAAAAVEPVEPVRADARTDHAAQPATISRLVAGTVPGRISFSSGSGGEPDAAGAAAVAYPMYRHPADRNAAATAVTVGRRLDVQG